MPSPKKNYRIKVTLQGSKPPIWRRILIPENITLYKLHQVLQIVMGWDDYHLHIFTIKGQIFGDPAQDEYGDLNTKSEKHYHLNKLISTEGEKFLYEYDFGDGWIHSIVLEKIQLADSEANYPVCVAGKRACPPEDVGGIWRYKDFLDAISDPTHEEHQDFLDWVGGTFDPQKFDIYEINVELSA